jgi:hypothetical protein
MGKIFENAIEPLIRKKIFKSEEEAVQKLIGSYLIHELDNLKKVLQSYENRYHMDYNQFCDYIREKSLFLTDSSITSDLRKSLSKEVMSLEDDKIEWKATKEMMENWLGLR